jgi:hypothetical protein
MIKDTQTHTWLRHTVHDGDTAVNPLAELTRKTTSNNQPNTPINAIAEAV